MIRAVIIEDESNSRELLQQMLKEYCDGVALAGEAVDVNSGIELIKATNPELVFLDVEMPGGTGFDVLNAFESPRFKIIFVTGYNDYAIKAIKYSALDYLLKPVSLQELRLAVQRVKETVSSHGKNLEFLKEQLDEKVEHINQILISDNRSHQIIKVEEILFIEAERTYVTFHLENDKKYVAANPLNYYEDLLPDASFFRIHKSYIVNCHKVVKLETGRGGFVYLNKGVILPVAIRRKPAFMRFLENIA